MCMISIIVLPLYSRPTEIIITKKIAPFYHIIIPIEWMIFSCFLVIPPSFQERRPYLFQLNECASLAWSMRRGRPYLSFISYPWYDRRNHHHYSEKAKSNTTVQRAVYSGPHGWRPSHGPPGIWPRTDIALNSLWNLATDRHRVELTIEFCDGQTSRWTHYGMCQRTDIALNSHPT